MTFGTSHRRSSRGLAEALEARRLFAAIEAGILVARGTDAADTIAVRRTGIDDVVLTTNGVSQVFDMDDFTTIRMEGLGGRDTFDVVKVRDVPTGVMDVTILGGDGNDRVRLHDLSDPWIDGGSGVDTVDVSDSRRSRITFWYPDVENLTGAGNFVREVFDNFFGHRIEANGGPNGVWLDGAGGNDTLIGGPGNDSLTGGDRADSIIGNGGDDTLIGESGDDTLVGGEGNDTLNCGIGGADVADGGPGVNVIIDAELTTAPPRLRIVNRILTVDGSWGQDLITIRRTLIDDVIVSVNTTSRQFDMDDFDGVLLRGNEGRDEIRVLEPIVAGSLVRKVTLEGSAGDDTLQGSSGEEVLRGGDGNDRLDGTAGNDALFGGGGADSLIGGDGNDFLNALDGAPFDTVLGGNGTDLAEADPGDDVSGVETLS